MTTAPEFLDTERVLLNALDGLTIYDPYTDVETEQYKICSAFLVLPSDFTDHLPAIAVYATPGGDQNDWEQDSQVTVNVYAHGVLARDIAKIIADHYNTDEGFEFAGGYVDSIRPVTMPHSIPYADPSIQLASLTLRLIHRIQ